MRFDNAEIVCLMGRGDAIVIDNAEPPIVGDVVEVNGERRTVVGVESFGQRPPWGVVLGPPLSQFVNHTSNQG